MKNVVITGANKGIGLALAAKFSTLGFQVFALCRQTSEALEKLDLTVISAVEITSEQGLLVMKQKLAAVKIDILINNAGIFSNETITKNSDQRIDSQRILEQFRVNALAPLQIVDLLKDQFQTSAKIAFLTSRMGSIGDNSSGGYYGYRMSKTALNAAAVSLAHDLAPANISVALYHPGWVQTDMVGNTGDINTTEAAEKLSKLIIAQNMSTTGSFTHSNGEALPW